MANVPDGLQYTEEHEWVAGDVAPGATVTVGVTEYAAAALGDIVYVEAPAVGDAVVAGTVCGELESTKAVSELYAPLTGTVTEVNAALASSPEILNSDAYGEGWIFRMTVTAPNKGLLDSASYAAITE